MPDGFRAAALVEFGGSDETKARILLDRPDAPFNTYVSIDVAAPGVGCGTRHRPTGLPSSETRQQKAFSAGETSILVPSAEAEAEQVAALAAWRAARDPARVREALRALRSAAASGANIMAPSIEAAKAGVTTGAVQRLARESGLRFPPDPGAAEISQLGGNIACNAGGPHAFKYGVTGNWVTGIEAVVPPGEIVRFGGPLRKDVAA